MLQDSRGDKSCSLTLKVTLTEMNQSTETQNRGISAVCWTDRAAASGTSDRLALPDSRWRSRTTPGAVRWCWRRCVRREFRRCAIDTAPPRWRSTPLRRHRATWTRRHELASRTRRSSPAASFHILQPTSALRPHTALELLTRGADSRVHSGTTQKQWKRTVSSG